MGPQKFRSRQGAVLTCACSSPQDESENTQLNRVTWFTWSAVYAFLPLDATQSYTLGLSRP